MGAGSDTYPYVELRSKFLRGVEYLDFPPTNWPVLTQRPSEKTETEKGMETPTTTNLI